jgi:hypothetical protein
MLSRVRDILASQVENPRALLSAAESLLVIVTVWLAIQVIGSSVYSSTGTTVYPEAQPDHDEVATAGSGPGRRLGVSHYVGKLTQEALFGKGRQQLRPEQPVAVRKSAAELLSEYEIQGVIQGRTPKVILLEKATAKTVTVGVGETIAGMTVKEISDNYVTFELLGEAYEVSY